MATSKLTFTLDEETVRHIADAAIRLKKPKSQVVREAVSLYHDRIGKLSEAERLRMLRVMKEIRSQPPTRPQHQVDEELKENRRARRVWASRWDK